MATRSVIVAPVQGWGTFTRSAAVTDLVWEALATWHYINPASRISIWESGTGATFYLAYADADATVVVEAVVGETDEPDDELRMLRERLRRDFGIDARIDAAPG